MIRCRRWPFALVLLAAVVAAPARAQEGGADAGTDAPGPVAAPAPAPAPAARAGDDVPLTRVVMFTSGVAYFERDGTIDGDSEIRLDVPTDHMSDLLKSLVVMADGARVAGVRYPSREPLARALAGFGIDLSGDPTLPQILGQLRGERVVLETPSRVDGRIVSVETKKVTTTGNGPAVTTEETYLTLFSRGELRRIPLDSVQSIRVLDPSLGGELDRALTLLASSRDDENRTVTVTLAAEGKAEVRLGWIAEAPVWQASYRLDLGGEKPWIQGFGIVENTTDRDWEGVSLSLVSGLPLSFSMDLYSPLWVDRPEVEPITGPSIAPPAYRGGVAAADRKAEEQARQLGERLERRNRAAAEPARPQSAEKDAFALAKAVELAGGAAARAAAEAVGELFTFTIDEPVSIPRRQSAMIPILATEVDAEPASVYDESVLPDHPLRGAILENDTGMMLPGGPLTVFDGGTYAGDSRIRTLPRGERRILTYAVDLKLTVDASSDSASTVTGGRIVEGTLVLSRRDVYTKTYAIASSADEARTVVVLHPYHPDRKLVAPAEPMDRTSESWRLKTTVPPGKTKRLDVREERVREERIALGKSSIDRLLDYARTSEIPADVREQLGKVLAMKRDLESTRARIHSLEQERDRIAKDQERIRKNLESVGKEGTLGQRYVQELSSQEDRLDEIETRLADLRAQAAKQEQELSDHLAGLTIGK